jgi:glutaconate CoA-transferase subunit B
MTPYTPREIMTIAAAREIQDGEIVFCGTGISMLAAMAAKHISAPNSVIFFETGAVDARLDEVPMSVADSRVMFGTAVNGSLIDAFSFMQNSRTGRKVVGILGAAQIDKFGNLNSTVIGDHAEPDVRFSGSGGACDAAAFVNRTIIFMQQEKRKFVPEVDYMTSPGWMSGPGSREAVGLPPGGPSAVVTNMAVLGFDENTREMYLRNHYPGVSPEQVSENMGFQVDLSRSAELRPPSDKELKILRELCDPQRLILD